MPWCCVWTGTLSYSFVSWYAVLVLMEVPYDPLLLFPGSPCLSITFTSNPNEVQHLQLCFNVLAC